MSLSNEYREILLHLAKTSIQHGLTNGKALSVDLSQLPIELTQTRATFVTLEINHKLRGCIGMLEATRPLAEDIAENAFAAAFKDPRFPQLEQHELDRLDIHLSILSRPVRLDCHSEQDLIDQIRPGIDGLILEDAGKRGTFLPSVWESLPEPQQFIQHLKRKAGLTPNHWSDNLTIQRYTAEYIE